MSEWGKARKKPVEVEFREVNADTALTDRLTGEFIGGVEVIRTREGKLFAYPKRDYIIRGVEGEEYPINKDIFAKTYDITQPINESQLTEKEEVFYDCQGYGPQKIVKKPTNKTNEMKKP